MSRPAFADQLLIETVALPNGAATVYGAAIEVGCGTPDDFPVQCEVKISAPAVVVGDLGNSDTLKYSIVTSDEADLSNRTVLLADLITQTGAGGAGAAAAIWQGPLPIGGVRKYVGLKVVNSGAGDASDKSATFQFLF